MSHYALCETELRDQDALVEALEELDSRWVGNIEMSEVGVNLFGYHGDRRPEIANIVIPRAYISPSSNDIGFVRDPATGKFRAIISDFDSRTYNARWLNSLKQVYAKNVVLKEAKRSGLRMVRSEQREDGSLKLVLEV